MDIELQEIEWECGDGCCTSYYWKVCIDGEELEDEFGSEAGALGFVLTSILNHNITYKWIA